jgi:acyl-CoA thioesterase-1
MRRLAATLLLLPLLALTPAPRRVLILGDSLARGAYASNPAAAYAGRVAVALGAVETTLVPAGGRLESAEAAWGAYGEQGWDLVVLEVGINDTLAPTLDDQAWGARYAALVAAARASGAAVVCVTPFDTGHALEARAARIRENCPGGSVADVYAATRGRAELRAPIGTPGPYAEATDAYHPGDAGHALMAEVILRAAPRPVWLPLMRGASAMSEDLEAS